MKTEIVPNVLCFYPYLSPSKKYYLNLLSLRCNYYLIIKEFKELRIKEFLYMCYYILKIFIIIIDPSEIILAILMICNYPGIYLFYL